MNIIFDIGMVLGDFRWHDYSVDRGIPESSIKMLADRMINDPVWDEFDRAVIPHEEVIKKLEERFPECIDDYRKFWKDITDLVLPFDYSEGWLADLRARGHRIYLLSNYSGFMFEVHSKKFGFLKYIDGKVISYEYHIMKPDPKIYNILLEKYSLDPADCIFIDDRAVNIEGGERCGIKGIVFTDYEDAHKKLEDVIAAHDAK